MKTLLTPTVLALAHSFNGFGFRLYHQLPPDGNLFFSPFSVAAALAALLPGARAETALELAEALDVETDPAALGSSVSALIGALEPRTTTEFEFVPGSEMRAVEREAFHLTLATGLFVEEAYPLHKAYRDLLTTSFRTDWFSLRFADKTGAATKINEWVAEKTGGRITRLVSPEFINDLTRLVVANAVYFLGRWLVQFPTANTRLRPFHTLGSSGSKTVQVPMMRLEMDYEYWSDEVLGLEVLWVPYAEELAMVVLLPREGRFNDLERRLEASLFERMNKEKRDQLVELQLPKFELRSSCSLATPIEALGVRCAFDPDLADFAGITPHPDGLVVDEVIHEGWIKVDEYGTEAAATAVLAAAAGVREIERPKPLPFIVDRPFYFLIQDDRTGSGLFLGRVTDPSV